MDERTVERGDALALVERDESHFWDQKSALGGGAVVQKIAVALANADGGDFAVGIEDRDSGYIGLDRWRGFAAMEDGNFVLEAVARDVQPPVPYTVEWLRIEGNDGRGIVCAVSVQKSDDVHRMADGTVWIRRGTSSVQITGQQIIDLTLAKGARSYEDQALAAYSVGDLVREAELAYFLRSYSPATPPEEFVRKQRLVDRDTERVLSQVQFFTPRTLRP